MSSGSAGASRRERVISSHVSKMDILKILKRLNEDYQKTIVMVTHDPHAASYAFVTRHLNKGMLLPPG